MPRLKTVDERLAYYAHKPDGEEGCWEWTGALIGHGYGQISLGHHTLGYAHRVAYEKWVGKIPDGMTVDHICRNRKCFNPNHLRVLSRGDNVRVGDRSWDLTGRCRKGLHDMTDEQNIMSNGPTKRTCRACWRLRQDRKKDH